MKLNNGYKIVFAIFMGLSLGGLIGCALTSFERGVIAGEAAQAIFDSPGDEAKFQRIKADIVAYLATERPITRLVVDTYVARMAEEFSPAFVAIVSRRLEAELPALEIPGVGELDDGRIREFLTGVAATIE